MNAFARGLFQLLIGWMRGLSSLWDGSFATLDRLSGWISGHWLGLALLLVLLGTAADFVVWLLRWRPYRAWASRLKAMRGLSLQGILHEIRFHRGYSGDNTQIMEAARPILTDSPVSSPAQDEDLAVSPNAFTGREHLEMDLGVSSYPEPSSEKESVDGLPSPGRRRRSGRARPSRLRGAVMQMRERLHKDEEEDDYEPDILPPIMSKEEAFRAPVYPKGQSRPGQQPNGGQEP